ncbi:MAG: hypothetical protein WC069_05815 [Candidatus Shapirobacteria bacterium]
MAKKELIGYCSVDSGQLMITDPCYALDNERYTKVCEKTIKEKIGSVIIKNIAGNCIALSTNTGDGSYPVYVERHKDGKQIKKVIIELDCWD